MLVGLRPRLGLAAMVFGNPRREDAALLARRQRNCRPVAPVHDPLLFVARVDVDVLPTNAPGISRQIDWQLRYRDRFPIDTRHHGVERGRTGASSSRTLTPSPQRPSIRS